MCANFTISTALSEWRLFPGSLEVFKYLCNVQSQHTLSLLSAAYSTTAAAAHSVSGELNTHLISNWIFNQPVSALKVMNSRSTFFPHAPISSPCFPLSFLRWDFEAFFKTFVLSTWHMELSFSCQNANYYLHVPLHFNPHRDRTFYMCCW